MRIVVVSPSGAALTGLGQLHQPITSFVTWSDTHVSPQDDPDDDIAILRIERPRPGRLAERVTPRLKGSAAGRNLLRLTPWDPGRSFARRAAHDQALRDALAGADLVIAAERDAILTVWRFGRAYAPDSARLIYGLAAASNLLESS